MAKASVEKTHIQVGTSGVVAPGVSQVTLLDVAFPAGAGATMGPGWVYVHVSGDPAAGNSGVVEVVAMVLEAVHGVPSVLTGAAKDDLQETVWWQCSVTYGAGGAGTVFLPVKTQRSIRANSRLVIVAVTESFAAAPQSRSVTTRGQLMRIEA